MDLTTMNADSLRLAAQRAGGFLPGPLRRWAGRVVRPGGTDAVQLPDWSMPLLGDGELSWPARQAGSHAQEPPAPVPAEVRCVLVTESLDAGGMDEFVAFLARGMRARGVEVAVLLVPVGVARGIGPIGRELLAEGIEVVDGASVQVEDWIESWAPTVISVHGNARSPIDAGHRLGIPVMLVLHGMHDLLGMSDSELLDRYARLDRIVSVSELVRRQYLARSPLIDPSRVITIPNGIDANRTVGVDRAQARSALGLDDEFFFLSLARHSLQKNTFGLVSAFDDVARAHPSAQLVICGRVDDPGYARQVMALRDRSPFANRIHLRDGTRRPDALLAAADAFVLDSFFEGWALSSMEALVAGVPVIASDVGGAREQLAGGPSRGSLVSNPLGDPLAVGWESMARARFAPQANRAELIAAMDAFVRRDIELAPSEEISADARDRFDADRCLDLHAEAIRAVAVGTRSPRPPATNPPRMSVAEIPVHLLDQREALGAITERWRSSGPMPLGVASINLDHVHHFGVAGASHRLCGSGRVEWLNLIDGAPIAAAARRLTSSPWPRLAGSDLIGPLLDEAERDGVRVGFLGGADDTRRQLLERLARERPGLVIAGSWSPTRHQITDDAAARLLAGEVRAAGVDLLVVGLGKPRQEVWIDRHGAETGARVLLAFGAVVDFLAGRVSRAPDWISRAGMEWAWRLALEPRRLARRYLVQGPAAYLAARRAVLLPAPMHTGVPDGIRGAVIIPAHDEAAVIERTLSALAPLTAAPGIEVIVVCNGTTDGTAAYARRIPGVRVTEIAEASKTSALNEGDRLATTWPRVYLDADIETTPTALATVLMALDERAGRTDLEAARPASRYDTVGASALVRAYYHARVRIPSFGEALWGAGAYAVSQTGHARFAEFPALTADDLFIDRLFPAECRAVLSTDPVVVRTPRTLPSLLRVLRRGLRAGQDQGHDSSGRTARELLSTVRGPRGALDAAVYAGVVAWARRGPGASRTERWERDDSSRSRT